MPPLPAQQTHDVGGPFVRHAGGSVIFPLASRVVALRALREGAQDAVPQDALQQAIEPRVVPLDLLEHECLCRR